MSGELVLAIGIQCGVAIFSAGLLWMKTSDISERVKRIEEWINGTRNEGGQNLKRTR